jgi:NADPH-dependent F420 reductase
LAAERAGEVLAEAAGQASPDEVNLLPLSKAKGITQEGQEGRSASRSLIIAIEEGIVISIAGTTIAVLGGTGPEGTGLALRWASAGARVLIGSRDSSKAEKTVRVLLQRLPSGSFDGMLNGQAARVADISVLTVNAAAHAVALQALTGCLEGKILVDATARVDWRDPKPAPPPSAGRQAQEALGHGVQVVAAFQNVPAHALSARLDAPLANDVLVCADDVHAAEVVVALVEAAGMNGYYAGDLDNGLVVENLTALIICMNRYYKSKAGAIRVTGIGRTPVSRD